MRPPSRHPLDLSADEVAHRSFTPSADGYHQGEVREFLARVSAQLDRDPATAIAEHAVRLDNLEDQLNAALDTLAEIAAALGEQGAAAEARLQNQLAIADDQRATLVRLETAVDRALASPQGLMGDPTVRSAEAGAAPASATGATPEPSTPADEQALITDNANDLLDNVVDDVMGNLTEGANTP